MSNMAIATIRPPLFPTDRPSLSRSTTSVSTSRARVPGARCRTPGSTTSSGNRRALKDLVVPGRFLLIAGEDGQDWCACGRCRRGRQRPAHRLCPHRPHRRRPVRPASGLGAVPRHHGERRRAGAAGSGGCLAQRRCRGRRGGTLSEALSDNPWPRASRSRWSSRSGW